MNKSRLKEQFEGQSTFDFDEGEASAIDIPKASIVEMLNLINSLTNDYAESYSKQLADHGIKIFPIKTINDRDAVEADYGAPSTGLSLFQDVIHPTRSYRYEPVETVEGSYRTHTDQSRAIGRALKAQGYKIFNGLTENEYPSQIHFTNGGVTRAFSDIIHAIIEKFEKVQDSKKVFGIEQSGGAIFVPVPTYGLFLGHLEKIVKDRNVDVVRVRRNDDGSVNIKSLQEKIEDCTTKNIRIIGYYDCSPHNPTGHIRTRQETLEIAQILTDASMRQIERDVQIISPIHEEYAQSAFDRSSPEYDDNDNKRKNILRGLSYAADLPQGSIVIIDDMAYEGLELVTNNKPFSFAQTTRLAAERTVTLKGISKIGMPGMRIGLAIGHHEIIGPLSDKQLFTEFTANSLGVDVLTARYGSPERRQLFRNHQRKLARRHKERALFFQAFFKGIDNVPELSHSQKRKLVTKLAHYLNVSETQSHTMLQKGLPTLYISDVPECGFFQIINCEALKGKAIAVTIDDNKMPYYEGIFSCDMLYCVFKAFGIDIVPASWQGLPDGCLNARVTYSMPEADFYNFFDRISKLHDFFWGEKPEVQLDLFRTNQFYPAPK